MTRKERIKQRADKKSFMVNSYHPEDETIFSWFAKQVPSIGMNGQYTYLSTFTTPSPSWFMVQELSSLEIV